ncbi:MAG: hypothetical protein AAGA30_18525, partial [Planctomycetota bacterium]
PGQTYPNMAPGGNPNMEMMQPADQGIMMQNQGVQQYPLYSNTQTSSAAPSGNYGAGFGWPQGN